MKRILIKAEMEIKYLIMNEFLHGKYDDDSCVGNQHYDVINDEIAI